MAFKLNGVVKALRAVVEPESSPRGFVCTMRTGKKEEGNLALGAQQVIGVSSSISKPRSGQGFIK